MVDTACTRTRNEYSDEVLFDNTVTETKHLDDEMRSSTRENGKVAVERPGGGVTLKEPLRFCYWGSSPFDIPHLSEIDAWLDQGLMTVVVSLQSEYPNIMARINFLHILNKNVG